MWLNVLFHLYLCLHAHVHTLDHKVQTSLQVDLMTEPQAP